MSTDDNKAVVRRFVEDVFVGGRPEAVDELLADDFVSHAWPSSGEGNGKADLKAAMDRVAQGLADARFTIEDMIAEDDRVAVRLTASARQTGPFMGIPPSGKTYTVGEIHIFRVRGARLVEHWDQVDYLTMLRQLGAMPGG